MVDSLVGLTVCWLADLLDMKTVVLMDKNLVVRLVCCLVVTKDETMVVNLANSELSWTPT